MRKDVELIGGPPLSYCPKTGLVTFTASVGSRKAGDIAGTLTSNGYLVVKVHGKSYQLHRLAFVLMGESITPDKDVDHINRVKTDNRWENLRLVSRSKNALNAKLRHDNKLSEKNIRKLGKSFQVRLAGKSLGCYNSLEEAKTVRDLWMIREVDENGEKVKWKPPTRTP